MRIGAFSWAGVVVGLIGVASGAPTKPLPAATRALLESTPGLRVARTGDRVTMLFGKGMARGATPRAAAEAFLDRHVEALGAGRPALALERADELFSSASTVFVYEQSLDGLPVERARVRILVKSTDAGAEVALVSGRPVAAPEAGFRPDALTGAEAIGSISRDPAWAGIQQFGAPSLVVYAGEGDEEAFIEPVRAWKVVGEGRGIGAVPLRRTFFVDASTGKVVFARDEIHFGTSDVSGTVQGWGSPGMFPDDTYNPPTLMNIPEIRAQISGGNSAFADTAGAFVINNALAGPLTLSATVAVGRWVAVNNSPGAEITASVAGVTPPGPAGIVLNDPPPAAGNSFTTAQVNAFIHQTLAHNYFRDRAPAFAALDTPLPANVNLNDTCNAFFDGIALSTNFFVQGESATQPGVFCVNTAFSGVVAHEYGHFIVNRLGLAQGAFGEGFSDTIALLLYDDGILGRGFRLNNPGSFVRNPEGANIQYPCSASCGGGSHCCGQILGGTVWDMRNNFVNAYGLPAGLDILRQLHVDWALITAGGIGSNSAHPQTAVEWLTVDDDDADLSNGTPNYALLCDAFAQHSIACPALELLEFQYPSGRPSLLDPAGGTTLTVHVLASGASPAPNSGLLFYSVDNGPFVSIPMTEGAPGEYSVAFPALPCFASVRYFVSVGLVGGGSATDPSAAPSATFSALVATSSTTIFDASESGGGWSLGVVGDGATTGLWTFGDPVGTAAQPEDDHTPAPGTLCFFTGQGSIGGGLGEADVDGGTTTLMSPAIDLSGVTAARISYWRWYSNTTGADPNNDVFTVQASTDGTTWVNVEIVGPAGGETNGGWFFREFDVASVVPLSAGVRIRFIASDLGLGSLVEAAVDDVRVDAVACTVVPPFCLGDADRDGDVDFADVTTILATFGGPGPQGDADNDGDVDFADVTTVLANFNNVCA